MSFNEEKVFGVSVDALKRGVKGSLTYHISGARMLVASVLSDAQELIELGETEQARQYINRAKFILMEEEFGVTDRQTGKQVFTEEK